MRRMSLAVDRAAPLLASRLFEDYRHGRLELGELYLVLVVGFGGVFALLMLSVGLFTRERVPAPATVERFTLAGFLRPLRLGAYRRLLGMYLCQALAFDVVTTTVLYYTLYVVVGVSSQVLLGIFIGVNVLAYPLMNVHPRAGDGDHDPARGAGAPADRLPGAGRHGGRRAVRRGAVGDPADAAAGRGGAAEPGLVDLPPLPPHPRPLSSDAGGVGRAADRVTAWPVN